MDFERKGGGKNVGSKEAERRKNLNFSVNGVLNHAPFGLLKYTVRAPTTPEKEIHQT